MSGVEHLHPEERPAPDREKNDTVLTLLESLKGLDGGSGLKALLLDHPELLRQDLDLLPVLVQVHLKGLYLARICLVHVIHQLLR
jgi:hypothetical protein